MRSDFETIRSGEIRRLRRRIRDRTKISPNRLSPISDFKADEMSDLAK